MTPESGSVDPSEAVAGPVRLPARCVTVQRQFDQRARRFAGASTIVREVGQRLFERLETIRPDGRIVVDLGCAAGAQQAALLRHFAPGTWIGIDLSHAMLVQAPQGGSAFARWLPRTLRPRSHALRICANADCVPLASYSVDCVFSNLMLNWHPAPHRVFPEIARVLREGGLLLFSSLGPDTLRELREACAAALPHARPMPFVDMHDLGHDGRGRFFVARHRIGGYPPDLSIGPAAAGRSARPRRQSARRPLRGDALGPTGQGPAGRAGGAARQHRADRIDVRDQLWPWLEGAAAGARRRHDHHFSRSAARSAAAQMIARRRRQRGSAAGPAYPGAASARRAAARSEGVNVSGIRNIAIKLTRLVRIT